MIDPGRILPAALLMAALPGTPAPPAAAPQEPDPAPLIEREEVRFVTLDIVTEEEAGGWRPLRDLTIDGIEIRVGDRPMPLDLFEDHCRSAAALPSPPAGGSAEIPPADAPPSDRPPAGRRYILYFDMEHLALAGRDAAFRAAMRWAGRDFDPADEVMIITAGRGLRILRALSPAVDHLREDLDAAREEFRGGELWGALETVRLEELKDEKDPTAYRMLAESYAAIDRSKTRNSLANLRDVMTIFEAVEGTKNLLLFADTIRLLPGRQYGVTPRLTDVSTDLADLAAAANERNVRFYPVQAGLPLVLPGSDPRSTHADSAFTMLAHRTGGKVFEGSNAVDGAFALVDEDLSCFYRAGFRVRPRYSGGVEPIVIRLLDRERQVRLRYRRTLEDPTREDLAADLIRAAFMAPSTARAFPIEVRAATLFRRDGGARLRVEVDTPLGSFLGLPLPGERPGARQVRLEVGARVVPLRPPDEDSTRQGIWAGAATDRPTSGFSRGAVLTLPPDPHPDHDADHVVAAAEFDAPPGRYRVVAVVLDQLARSVAAAVTDIEVGTEAPRIGSIRLASENRSAVLVPEAPSGDAGRDPSDWNGEELASASPFVPPEALLNGTAIVEPGSPVHLIYSVCLPHEAEGRTGGDDGAIAGGRRLERTLTCGPESRSVRLPPRSLAEAEAGRHCVPLLDTIPPDALRVGRCRIDLVLPAPGGGGERAVREFTVVPPAGRDVADERPAA